MSEVGIMVELRGVNKVMAVTIVKKSCLHLKDHNAKDICNQDFYGKKTHCRTVLIFFIFGS